MAIVLLVRAQKGTSGSVAGRFFSNEVTVSMAVSIVLVGFAASIEVSWEPFMEAAEEPVGSCNDFHSRSSQPDLALTSSICSCLDCSDSCFRKVESEWLAVVFVGGSNCTSIELVKSCVSGALLAVHFGERRPTVVLGIFWVAVG